MKMDKVANSGNDEFYTPAYAIEPIMKYIKSNSTIWCPFDTEQSLFVKMFREAGHRALPKHILLIILFHNRLDPIFSLPLLYILFYLI